MNSIPKSSPQSTGCIAHPTHLATFSVVWDGDRYLILDGWGNLLDADEVKKLIDVCKLSIETHPGSNHDVDENLKLKTLSNTLNNSHDAHFALMMARSERVKQEERQKAFQAKQSRKRHTLYLFEAVGLNRFKIGYSTDPQSRLEQLRRQSSSPIEIVCILQKSNARKLEGILHRRFEQKRAHGEWFDLSQDDIEYIKSFGCEA